MSFGQAYISVGVFLIAAWLFAVLAPITSRGWLGLSLAILLTVIAAATLGELHYSLFDVNGEESMGVALVSMTFVCVGIVGITLSLLIRAKLRPFGIIEEEKL